jgi:hypothetical protein
LRNWVAVIAIAAGAGLLIGVLDLWLFDLSWRGFLAGVAAGFVYALMVLVLWQPGLRVPPLFLAAFAIVAGSVAGTIWWLVARGSRLWVAIAVGAVLALSHFAGQGVFAGRR